MNNQQITNPKVEVPKGMALNDKDHIGGILSELKCMEKNYAVALTEASNETLYQSYKTMFNGIAALQREVYELMFRCGWYPMEKAPADKISQTSQMLTQEWNDLSQGNA